MNRAHCLWPLLLVLLPPVALAKEKAAPAKASALTEVKKDLAAGEFERALKKIDAALRKTSDAAEQAQLLLARGQALMAMGTPDKAKAAFAAAVQKDPTAELDPTRASPDAVKLFEKARAEIPATLAVTVTGGEANLSVDDKDMGPAPLTLQLEGGKHVIDAKGSEGRIAHRELTLSPGRKVDLALELSTPPRAPGVDAPLVSADPGTGRPAPKDAFSTPPPSTTVKKSTTAEPSRSKAGLVPLIGGAVVAGVGAALLWQANVKYQTLATGTGAVSPADEQALVSDGRLFQALGWAGVGLGAAALATGVVMLAVAPAEGPKPQVGVMLTPGGGFVSVRGEW